MATSRTYLEENLQFLNTHRAPSAFAALAVSAVVRFLAWEERRRTRVALAKLDDHILKDIGLTKDDVDQELGRRNWLPITLP
jgi:uncharacterized protein YjiS (DUF1127 family)